MKTLKSYFLTEKFQPLGPIGGEQLVYHLQNASDKTAEIRCGDGETADIVTIEPGETATVAVPRGMRVAAAGCGELRITSGEISGAAPSGGAASARGETDVSGLFTRIRPDLWTPGEIIDWGDGTYSILLKKTATVSTSHAEMDIGILPLDIDSVVSVEAWTQIGSIRMSGGHFASNVKFGCVVIINGNDNRVVCGISHWETGLADLFAAVTFTRNQV
jgi:hypothetical protein